MRVISGRYKMITRRRVLQSGAAGATLASMPWAIKESLAAAGRTAVNFEVPRGACDCHVHIQDPDRFPYVANRLYTPGPASVEELTKLQQDLKLERVVIVQPSVYGTDNRCTLDAVTRLGPRARAIVVINRDTARGEVEAMSAQGARGVRLNLETNTAGAFDPSAAKALLDQVAQKIEGLNWHVQFYTRPNIIAALKDHLQQLPFPVVFDHFARARAHAGIDQPGFDAVLDLVKSGRAYVKVSAPYRVSERAPDYADVAPLAAALIGANPEQILWATDWPHPNSEWGRGKPLTEVAPPFPIDAGLLLSEFAKWAPDPAVRQKILVDNPARLYGFAA
jgi:predicted TIM-barrel fold metal-dependent hydrolase